MKCSVVLVLIAAGITEFPATRPVAVFIRVVVAPSGKERERLENLRLFHGF